MAETAEVYLIIFEPSKTAPRAKGNWWMYNNVMLNIILRAQKVLFVYIEYKS